MSIAEFQHMLQGPFATYLAVSQKIGGDVATHSALVELAFQAQLKHLVITSERQPPSETEKIDLFKPTSEHICAIQEFKEQHLTSPYVNHVFAISEGIPALRWVTVCPAPFLYIKDMKDASLHYANRVLNEWKEKDKMHVDWVKAWLHTLNELEVFVKEHHPTGLVWTYTNAAPVSMDVPPRPAFLRHVAQIDSREHITKNLKKVTLDMQTHKNPALRGLPPLIKTSQTVKKYGRASIPIPPGTEPPVFKKDGTKWIIEHHNGNEDLLVENAQMNNVVYLNKCVDCTLEVKGKINAITVDSCKKTALVFDSVVSRVEFINCQFVQMQVFGCVPTISIHNTDGCQIYLSTESLAVEIMSSKSSEMNVLVPKGDGDATDFPLPEKYKTTVSTSGLETIPLDFMY